MAISIVLMILFWGQIDTAHAAESHSIPVALILDLKGSINSGVQPFDEVFDGEKLNLGKTGTVKFAHYETCELIWIRGGTIRMSAFYWTATGEILARNSKPCPKRIEVDPRSITVGRTERDARGRASVSIRPTFVFSGSVGSKVDRLIVSRNDTTVLVTEIDYQGFAWPEGAPLLEPGVTYDLQMTGGGIPQPLIIRFYADPRAETLLLIKIE